MPVVPVSSPTYGDRFAHVDESDLATVADLGWTLFKSPNGIFYARARHPETRRHVFMHRLLMEAEPALDVDHEDRDGLNNRRANLRVATRTENSQNAKARAGSSQYKGVNVRTDPKIRKRYRARIRIDKRLTYLGTFATEEEAARAYDAAARQHFGDFARLNFPTGEEQPA